MIPPVTLLTGHEYNTVVGKIFARGCNGETRPVHEAPENGTVAFYGILRGTGEVAKRRWREGRDFLFIDHGYIGAGHYAGFYRVVRNDLHARLDEEPDYRRLLVHKWKPEAEHRSLDWSPILVAPPSEHICGFFGFAREAWLADIQRQIREITDRPIIATDKMDRPALDLLEKAYALVTLQSNVAVEAVRLGVPVFIVRGPAPERWWHPAQVWDTDLADLDDPKLPSVAERTEWAARLAAGQWTLWEMAHGLCWTSLQTHIS